MCPRGKGGGPAEEGEHHFDLPGKVLLEKVLGEAAVRRLGPQVARSWRLYGGGDGRIGDGTQQVGSLKVLHGV